MNRCPAEILKGTCPLSTKCWNGVSLLYAVFLYDRYESELRVALHTEEVDQTPPEADGQAALELAQPNAPRPLALWWVN